MKYTFYFFLFASFLLAACHSSTTEEVKQTTSDSALATMPAPKDTVPAPIDTNLTSGEGVAGVFDVPEMLCLAKIDSVKMEDASKKMLSNFALLQKEMERVGAVQDGPAGQINYNNDPNNFKFECVLLIKKMPEIQPRNCELVVLEASKMVVYNYYGPYNELHTAYKKIEEYCRSNKWIQSGPQRQFYINDPTVEKDPRKWHTRIMLPVYKGK